MAYSLLKTQAHNSFADGIYNELLTKASRYYYFLGKVLPWNGTDTNILPIVDSIGYEKDIRNEIVLAKEIAASDVSYVIPRVNWATGTTYDVYDDQYSTEIQGIDLTSGGSGYASAPTITIGTLCPVSSSVSLNSQYYYNNYLYTVTSAGTTGSSNTVLSNVIGTEYTHGSAKLTCVGMQATATCDITGSVVSSTTITYKGYGYTTNPIITFSSGTAAGSAVISSKSNLSSANYYAYSNNNVYVCVSNNGGVASTVAPSGANSNFLSTADGYVWKYMYTIPANDKFLYTNSAMMPVYTSRTNQYSANGSIVSINADNGGSGYFSATQQLPLSTAVLLNSYYYYNNYVYKVTTAGTTGSSYSGITTTIGSTWTSGSATFTCQGLVTTVTISGDGTGAVATPLTTNGKITNVQITSSGSGYTYANLTVSGSGKGAVLSALLYTGLTKDSYQDVIELATVPGQILSAQKISGGFGYSANPVVTITGDGTGATATATVSPSNRITGITLTNRGSNYNWATITITDSTGLGAQFRAVVSPYGGLGKDSVNQLNARSLMFYSKISNNTNHGLSVSNQYRQIGIIKDPNRLSDGTELTSNFATACWKITATANIPAGISEDDILTVTYSTTYRFRVVSISGADILLIPLDNGIPTEGMQFNLSTNSSISFIVLSVLPAVLDKYSGDLLFVDNESAFVSNSGNSTVLRTVINF